MNILPKKSWHVRTKRNIDRVRKDESRAAEEENERQRRIQLAESEARITLLRDKAKLKKCLSEERPQTDDAADNGATTGHLNFFSEAEKAERSLHATNADHEREKKKEQEAYEKKIGLLTYLGQSASEASGIKPWYSESHEERMKLFSVGADMLDKDIQIKDRMDPLKLIKQYDSVKCGLQENSKKIRKLKELMAMPAEEEDHHHRHHKKHKRERKKVQKSLEELRAERLHREQVERSRAEELLRKARGEVDDKKPPEVVMDDRMRGYNSQYNPHLAKK